ncbi:MAG: NAD(P)-binding domain-containing protein [Clostridia bacterium]|nr:NAD(P)-binding domain-containing protein [Deltaproteobacteria bacterium]
MKIGILGSGNMGRALGTRIAHAGHDVFFGARKVDDARAAADIAAKHATGAAPRSGSIDDAALFGDLLLWTMRETQPSKVLANAGVLDGKVLVDLNNRDYAKGVKANEPVRESLVEALQRNAPKTRVVKAFNTIGMESFDTSRAALEKTGAQVFLAGDDADAKGLVSVIAADLGFASVDFGNGAVAMRIVEQLGDAIRWLMIDGKRGGQAHFIVTQLPAPDEATFGERATSNYA